MIRWADLRLRHAALQGESQPIDMGNGRLLSAEDVLEGHFHRLATRTVHVQVKPDLQAALTVLAPKLAPLTEVAAEVAQVLPPIQPAAQFRRDLHRALELTHRQQLAQRKLGTAPHQHSQQLWVYLLLAATVVVFCTSSLFLLRRKFHTHHA